MPGPRLDELEYEACESFEINAGSTTLNVNPFRSKHFLSNPRSGEPCAVTVLHERCIDIVRGCATVEAMLSTIAEVIIQQAAHEAVIVQGREQQIRFVGFLAGRIVSILIVLRLTDPGYDLIRFLKDSQHVADLLRLFSIVGLVDANGITPDVSRASFISHVSQGGSKILSNGPNNAIAFNRGFNLACAPRIRQCLVFDGYVRTKNPYPIHIGDIYRVKLTRQRFFVSIRLKLNDPGLPGPQWLIEFRRHVAEIS